MKSKSFSIILLFLIFLNITPVTVLAVDLPWSKDENVEDIVDTDDDDSSDISTIDNMGNGNTIDLPEEDVPETVDDMNDHLQDELDEMNKDVQKTAEEADNVDEVEKMQEEIDANKDKMEDLQNSSKELQRQISDLQEQIPKYEDRAAMSLKMSQRIYNEKNPILFLASLVEENNLVKYMTQEKATSKLSNEIKNDTMELFTTIDEIKVKKEDLDHDLESLENLEDELLEEMDTLEEEEKKTIISNARSDSENFYNQYCEGEEVYGIDCGPQLEEVEEFERPIKEGYVTNEFGGWDALNQDDGHTGIDIAQDEGMDGYREVYPAGYGQVMKVFADSYGGIQVMVIHVKDGENYVTNYAHLESVDVLPGDIVSPDDQIGTMGQTGVATGIHLHFEIIQGPYYIHSMLENPRNYVIFPPIYLTFKEEEE